MIIPRPQLTILLITLCAATVAHAESARKNPASKLYVAEINGDAQIDRGSEIDDLTKKSVFSAAGSTVETKKDSNASVVLSNGTGLYVDTNTQFQIKEFAQDTFRPKRDDLEDEPSISATHLVISHGVLGVSTSKQAIGTSMVYDTPLASASIRGRQAVIVAEDNQTVISMLEGEATVQAGPLDRPRLVKNHQQIVIHPGNHGEQNIVDIQDIPNGTNEDQLDWLQFRVVTADTARQSVYFETQTHKAGDDDSITVFDGGSTDATGNGNGADGNGNNNNQIVAVPVVPASPSVDTNVSPANLTSH